MSKAPPVPEDQKDAHGGSSSTSKHPEPIRTPPAQTRTSTSASKDGTAAPEEPPRSGRAPDEPTNTPYSHVSGGGGERDRHHGHSAEPKRDTEEKSEERGKP